MKWLSRTDPGFGEDTRVLYNDGYNIKQFSGLTGA
jgi:hypothetical protein